MNIQIKSLENVPLTEIYDSFVEAFTNYVIPLQFNQEAMLLRWKLGNVDWKLSYGAFDNNKLVAFIIHTPVEKTLYNNGTGVIPSHRGLHLIERIYEVIDRDIKGFDHCALEVIKENTKAFALYQKLGFKIKRELLSFQGGLISEQEPSAFLYQMGPLEYKSEQLPLRLTVPCFENSQQVLSEHPESFELHELKNQDELLAYVIYQPGNNQLKEIGARSDRDLDELIFRMNLKDKRLKVMNVDSHSSLVSYLNSRRFEFIVGQYEMIRDY